MSKKPTGHVYSRQNPHNINSPATIVTKSAILSAFPPRRSFIDTCVTRDDQYWQNRVTLKVDIPFTDHSHIIGRGGRNTQEVMKQTACHVHFPDSNKNQDVDKSNQVSIAGPIDKVELARRRIRGLAPLSISFELKTLRPGVDIDALVSDASLETTLGFSDLNVVVRTNRSSGQPYCLVRGSVHQTKIMIDACNSIRNYLFAQGAPVSFSTSLEVLPEQQSLVIGSGGIHMQWIAERTGAAVHYPTDGDSRRGASTFYIAGPTVQGVVAARRYIQGLLPVMLTFELRKDNVKMDTPYVAQLEQELTVSIVVKFRNNNGIESGVKILTVRSCECNLTNVYLVRSRLVSCHEQVTVCREYDFMERTPSIITPGPTMLPVPPVSSVVSPLAYHTTAYHSSLNAASLMLQQGFRFAVPPPVSTHVLKAVVTPVSSAAVPCSFPVVHTGTSADIDDADHSSSSSEAVQIGLNNDQSETNAVGISPNQHESPIAHSLLAGAKNIDEQHSWKASDRDQLRVKASHAMCELPSSATVRTPTVKWMGLGFSHSTPARVHQQRRKQAERQLKVDLSNGMVPLMDEDSDYVGRYIAGGVSSIGNERSSIRRRPDLNATSYLDQSLMPVVNLDWNLALFRSPATVLAALGLNDYLASFHDQEIDMEAFLMLDEQNLIDLGVTTIGARKKLRIVIHKLKESALRLNDQWH